MKVSRVILSFAAAAVLAASTVLPVMAVNYGGGSVQAYGADAPIELGTIVQLTGDEANRVAVSTKSQLENMFGVVVDPNQLLITSSTEIENATHVAASGTYNTLVSTEGGPIAVGDYVTLSSIDGVAMKASSKETTVFGRVNAAFDGKGTTLGTSEVKDTSGNVLQTVSLGSVPVTIDVKHNPYDISTEANLPEFLERVGYAIAEKEVSPVRIYLSLAIMAISIITTIALLYAGVRNGIISIGRNPMSRKSIFKALMQVILTSLLILIIGLFAVYLLLRL